MPFSGTIPEMNIRENEPKLLEAHGQKWLLMSNVDQIFMVISHLQKYFAFGRESYVCVA